MQRFFSHEQTSPRSVLKQQLSTEVDLGIASAADPANANLPDLVPRVTTINSPWFVRTCRMCRDKFREGDQVRLCPLCSEPFHDDDQYDLHCWQKKFTAGAICREGGPDRFNEGARDIPRCEFSWPLSTDANSSFSNIPPHTSPGTWLVTQFVNGIETTWRPFGEQRSFKVLSRSAPVRRKCPWCRFRVRAGDWVVACPCQSDCGTYFHQDVLRHLTCWNSWNGVEGRDYCPNTSSPYPDSEGG